MNYSTKDLQKIVKQMRTKGFYVPLPEKRKIDWSAYTTNQINDIIDTLHFIRNEIDKIHVPRKRKSIGRPLTDAGVLAKAILFVELFTINERNSEGWLMLLGHHLGIEQRIDDRVLGKAYFRLDVVGLLEKVFENNIDCDGSMGGDGSGIEKSRKENYESTKKKGLYLTSIVDSREIVQAFDISGKHECRAMHNLVKIIASELKKDVYKSLKKVKLTLDSGFVDKKLAQLITNSEIEPFIFPKKNNVLKSKGKPAWKKMLKKIIDDVQTWLREYHIRSHTESFHSSLKRIFGIITKRLNNSIYVQILVRIIHNNRRKLNYYNLRQVT